MKKLIFVHISIFCILFACHGKDIQSRHKNNNDSNKDCRTASVVVDCLEVDKVMGLVQPRLLVKLLAVELIRHLLRGRMFVHE